MSLFARLFRKEKEIESKIEPLIPLVQQDVASEEPQAEEPAEDFWNMTQKNLQRQKQRLHRPQ